MQHLAIAILIILMPHGLMAASRLQYISSIPIQYTSKLTVEIQESLPILNLNTKGNQILIFDLVLKKDEGKAPITKLPLSLTLALKDLFIFLSVNGIEFTFNPSEEKASIPFMQMSQLIDKPMQLQIDAEGELIDKKKTFVKLFDQFPILKDLSLQELFQEFFFHMFALCGHELTEGAKFQKKILASSFYSQPSLITYDVIEITDHDILARMKGTIKPKKLLLDASYPTDNLIGQKIEMVLSGDVQGDISWKRTNAMLYKLNCNYHYQADLKFGEMRWVIQMTISHIASSSTQ